MPGTAILDDLGFQFHSLDFVLVRQLHKPLIRDLSLGVVLIKLFVESGYTLISHDCLLEFCFAAKTM